jgi:hypothetical protein
LSRRARRAYLRARLRRVRIHDAPKARVGALDGNARSLGISLVIISPLGARKWGYRMQK